MESKYFLLAFICFSFAQVQGNELENAVKKGLIRVETLYNRGLQRIDNADKYQNQLIETKAEVFIQKIQRMREAAAQNLRRIAQIAEEKAKEMQKPDSAFECISKAEKNANDQIKAFATEFEAEIGRLQKLYSSKMQMAAGPLTTMRKDLKSRYEKTLVQIKECKVPKCVEETVNNFSVYVENVFEGVKRAETQISTIAGNFQREVRASLNNVNRQISRAESDGLREMKACVFARDAPEKMQ